MNNKEKIPFVTLSDNRRLYLEESLQQENGELTLQNFEFGLDIANRTSIINHLIKKNKLNNYLEIGVRDLRNFNKIIIENKVGVDPYPLKINENIHTTESNIFFSTNEKIFDIIFIDGLHLENQVDMDLQNSLSCLSKDGFIIMHDCNPPSKFHQREVYEVDGKFPAWNGTVWKSYAKLRIYNGDLNMSCFECDLGVGKKKKGFQKTFKTKKELNYK